LALAFSVRVGGFIADFVALEHKLIVEVDGASHRGRERADERRDRKLRRLGYRVLRLDAELVLGNLAEALARIRVALTELA
jgi:crossover junction endodeoxyribonuclease RuvC